MKNAWLWGIAALILLPVPALADGEMAGNGPALPPASGNIVNVATASELQLAVARLTSGTTIVLQPGTYQLTDALWVPQGLSQIAIRGSQNGAAHAVIVGAGMSGNIPFGIWMENVSDVLIADLTIGQVRYHGIMLNTASERVRIYNVRVFDTGEQQIKGSSAGGVNGSDEGRVEYCILDYTDAAPSSYANGVDIHTGKGWLIRDCLFKNIRAPQGQGLAGPALLMWNGSQGTVAEGNKFLNCDRGIAYGLGGGRADDHVGGVIRNNMIYRHGTEDGDAGIVLEASAGTKVLNNTIILNGTYPSAIEYRFPATTGVEIKYNLTDAAVTQRDGASADAAGNVTGADSSWFLGPAAGNLHLASTAAQAVDKASAHPDVVNDYDGQSRPQGSAPDVGADETASGGGGPSALLRKGDLKYLGAFRVARGQFGPESRYSFDYGGTAIAFDPADQGMYMVGHSQLQLAAKISVPEPVNSRDLEALPMAKLIQPFTSMFSGLPNLPSQVDMVGGFLPWQDRLIWTLYGFYDTNPPDVSHAFIPSRNLADPNRNGLYRIGSSIGSRHVAGYMTTVPPEWQADLGFPALTGQACLSIIGTTSAGPSASGFNPEDLGRVEPAPSVTFVDYPLERALADIGSTNPVFNGTTTIKGVVFPPGTRSVLFVGRHGHGNVTYGPGDGVDPVDNSKGYHAYPYYSQVWAYDVNDFIAVKKGEKQPWELRPYEVWTNLGLRGDADGSVRIGGAAFDPATRRLYISELSADHEGDYDYYPLVHVFEVAAGGGGPVAPSITRHPANQTVNEGQTATFSVSAAGSTPLSYQWQRDGLDITGATASSHTVAAAALADSGSKFRCVVSNSAGSAASSEATLTVQAGPPQNQPPSVNAGPDQTVTLPADANLSGAASDDGLPDPPGSITTTWSKVSGPGNVTFGNANALSTTAGFSAAGDYVVGLTAFDGELSSVDTLRVAVEPEPVPPDPPRIEITRPLAGAVILSSSVTVRYLLSGELPAGLHLQVQVDGRSPVVLDTEQVTGSYRVKGLKTGQHVVVLTLMDDEHQPLANPEATDSVAFQTLVNVAPKVNAGPNQTVRLAAGALLDGTVSDDGLPNPPAVVTATWTKVKGPGTVTFGNAASADTPASFSAPGTYVLRLKASDGGKTARHDVRIKVIR